MAKALWKYDDDLGVAYFCPRCKKHLCAERCLLCGLEDLELKVDGEPYRGRTFWWTKKDFLRGGMDGTRGGEGNA